ncbi:hypothetical protein QQX09_00585 [Demequina sp. SYSU T00192]|uniref:Uncharacterized protein n=1 Tax=Demequina litoralis TaxID=3051660 RepID=A0ABT8G5D0_9MICO|nr:hypothetical protein [Demequina sp. SYSU T00192]MDN4474343.1 hypothetical protein [Demequina sp. SYSU T00192]
MASTTAGTCFLPADQGTDALGDLVSVSAEEVVVETRRGTVRIVGDTMVTAKEVPPAHG